MRLPKWLLPVLLVALIVTAGSWITAGDNAAPDVAQAPPESAAIPRAVPVRDQMQAQAHVSEWPRAAQPPESVQVKPSQTRAMPAPPSIPVPAYTPIQKAAPLPPFGLQTEAEERRDLLHERRAEMLDTYGNPGRYLPPWFAAHEDNLERYRDARRSHFRQQRDFYRRRHASWTDSICPWTKPRRTGPSQYGYPWQTEQPDGRELFQQFLGR